MGYVHEVGFVQIQLGGQNLTVDQFAFSAFRKWDYVIVSVTELAHATFEEFVDWVAETIEPPSIGMTTIHYG